MTADRPPPSSAADADHRGGDGNGNGDGGNDLHRGWIEQLDRRLDREGSVVLNSRQLRTLFASIGIDDPDEEDALLDDLDAAAAAAEEEASEEEEAAPDEGGQEAARCRDDDDESGGERPRAGGGTSRDDGGGPAAAGEEGKAESEGERRMPESGPVDDSIRVRFDGLFADLRRFKEEEGHLAMPTSHPLFVSVVDKLADVGMEELLKERFYDQLRSLREFVEGNGHCRVPDDHPTLGEWTRRQRGHFERFKRRLPGPLTRKRYARLKEIAGFDDFDPSKEETKDETKEETKEETKDGPVAPPAEGLTLDERISLKRAARRVRRMAAGARAFSSSSSANERPRDREAVAAELRRKRASRRAGGGRTPRAEGGLASSGEGAASASAAIEETDVPPASPAPAPAPVEETDVPPASSAPSARDGASDREGGPADPAADDDDLEETRRRVRAELDAAMDLYGKKVEGTAGAGRRAARRRGGTRSQSMIAPSSSSNDFARGGGASYGTWLDRMKNADPAAGRANERKPDRSSKGRYLSASDTSGAAAGGVTFEERIRRKLEGDGPGDACRARRTAPDPRYEEKMRRKLAGEGAIGGRVQFVPARPADETKKDPDGRVKGKYLRALAPSNSIRGSTFDERLRRKLSGETYGDIYGDGPDEGEGGPTRKSWTVDDVVGAASVAGSDDGSARSGDSCAAVKTLPPEAEARGATK